MHRIAPPGTAVGELARQTSLSVWLHGTGLSRYSRPLVCSETIATQESGEIANVLPNLPRPDYEGFAVSYSARTFAVGTSVCST